MASRLAAYDPQLEIFEGDRASAGLGRAGGEIRELEQAIELMELHGEQGLQRFVRRLVQGAARATGGGHSQPAAEAIQRLLIGALRQAVSRRGPARGSVAPVRAATLGERLINIPDRSLGLELEGLSDEDRQFETARQIVRFASDAARRAIAAPLADPAATARAAALAAARRHAPGLVASLMPATPASFRSAFNIRGGPGPPSLRAGRGGGD